MNKELGIREKMEEKKEIGQAKTEVEKIKVMPTKEGIMNKEAGIREDKKEGISPQKPPSPPPNLPFLDKKKEEKLKFDPYREQLE